MFFLPGVFSACIAKNKVGITILDLSLSISECRFEMAWNVSAMADLTASSSLSLYQVHSFVISLSMDDSYKSSLSNKYIGNMET